MNSQHSLTTGAIETPVRPRPFQALTARHAAIPPKPSLLSVLWPQSWTAHGIDDRHRVVRNPTQRPFPQAVAIWSSACHSGSPHISKQPKVPDSIKNNLWSVIHVETRKRNRTCSKLRFKRQI